jgi:hypothetical protein
MLLLLFPEVNGMPAIIRDIETQMQPPPSLLMLEQHCLGLCLRHKASSLQALEIVEQLLQAYPAGISIRDSNARARYR